MTTQELLQRARALRVNVNSKIRSGATPCATTSQASLEQSVVVLPVPAPASTSSVGECRRHLALADPVPLDLAVERPAGCR